MRQTPLATGGKRFGAGVLMQGESVGCRVQGVGSGVQDPGCKIQCGRVECAADGREALRRYPLWRRYLGIRQGVGGEGSGSRFRWGAGAGEGAGGGVGLTLSRWGEDVGCRE